MIKRSLFLVSHLNHLCVSAGPSGWGGTSPTSPTVDNGTAAWGKPSDAPTGWGDPDDAGGKTTCWGNPSSNPIKSGQKISFKRNHVFETNRKC